MYYDNQECGISCISVMNLTIGDLKDQRYKELLSSCPEDVVPCEVNLGPIWHYLGANRRVELGFTRITLGNPSL